LVKSDKYKNVVIDTCGVLYQHCLIHICQKLKIEHPSDEEFGKGWAAVRDEFTRAISKLNMSKIGVVFISHSQTIEWATRTRKTNREVPKLSKQASEALMSLADIILFMESVALADGSEEVTIHTKPSADYVAGDRTQRLPEHIKFNIKEPIKTFNQIEGYFKEKEKAND